MSASAPNDIQSMVLPMTVCMGTIQLLRRPSAGAKHESTMGDQSSLSEYG